MAKNKVIKVKRKTAAEKAAFQKRDLLLFTLPGENEDDPDREYYCYSSVPAGASLAMPRVVAEQGEAAAAVAIMIDLIGEDAYNDLTQSEDLTKEDIEAIFERVAELVSGAANTGK